MSGGEHLVPQRRIVLGEVDGERVIFPALQQAHARGSLIDNVQDVTLAQLILGAEVPVQYVRIAEIRVPPLYVPGSIVGAYVTGG